MTNNTIQDKLSFFALEGTKDVIQENRMFIKRRRRQSTPLIADRIKTNNGLEVKRSIQLSLF